VATAAEVAAASSSAVRECGVGEDLRLRILATQLELAAGARSQASLRSGVLGSR
jgi:hypothetical protein